MSGAERVSQHFAEGDQDQDVSQSRSLVAEGSKADDGCSELLPNHLFVV